MTVKQFLQAGPEWDTIGALIRARGADWAFNAPIFLGDTLWVEMEITAKRMTSAGNSGIIECRFRLFNQHQATVQQGNSDMMIQLRPALETQD